MLERSRTRNKSDVDGNGPIGTDDGVETGNTDTGELANAGDSPESDDTPPGDESEPEPEEEGGFWSRILDKVQTDLDIAGFVPGLGAVPDLFNTGISLALGDKKRAAESVAAAVPGAGHAFKASRMGMRAVDRVDDARRASEKAHDVSKYEDVTDPRASLRNYRTDVPREEFGKNLLKNGYTKRTSKDGKAEIYTKDGSMYTIRSWSKSTEGPAAEYFKDGKPVSKIRLGEDE